MRTDLAEESVLAVDFVVVFDEGKPANLAESPDLSVDVDCVCEASPRRLKTLLDFVSFGRRNFTLFRHFFEAHSSITSSRVLNLSRQVSTFRTVIVWKSKLKICLATILVCEASD